MERWLTLLAVLLNILLYQPSQNAGFAVSPSASHHQSWFLTQLPYQRIRCPPQFAGWGPARHELAGSGD
jgi:hypothetical protein